MSITLAALFSLTQPVHIPPSSFNLQPPAGYLNDELGLRDITQKALHLVSQMALIYSLFYFIFQGGKQHFFNWYISRKELRHFREGQGDAKNNYHRQGSPNRNGWFHNLWKATFKGNLRHSNLSQFDSAVKHTSVCLEISTFTTNTTSYTLRLEFGHCKTIQGEYEIYKIKQGKALALVKKQWYSVRKYLTIVAADLILNKTNCYSIS